MIKEIKVNLHVKSWYFYLLVNEDPNVLFNEKKENTYEARSIFIDSDRFSIDRA